MPAAPISNFDTYRAIDMLTNVVNASRTARPNMFEFMNATSARTSDSGEILFGVIGSNAD